jgi:translation initiation factor IF-2
MIDQDSSSEFVEAFVTAVRPAEPRGRSGWWMVMVAIGVVFAVALASLLNGAIKGSKSTAAASTAIPASTATTLTEVAGPSCASGASSFTKVGYYTGTAQPSADWNTSKTGGYVGDGCTGGFVSLPLSGEATAYDSDRYALWTFHLSAALDKKASCRISTYVPDVKALSAVGGKPARYYYYGTAYASTAKSLGTYTVNQVDSRGKWVPDSSLTVTGGVLSVRLVDAGASTDARAAAAQMRLNCSAT